MICGSLSRSSCRLAASPWRCDTHLPRVTWLPFEVSLFGGARMMRRYVGPIPRTEVSGRIICGLASQQAFKYKSTACLDVRPNGNDPRLPGFGGQPKGPDISELRSDGHLSSPLAQGHHGSTGRMWMRRAICVPKRRPKSCKNNRSGSAMVNPATRPCVRLRSLFRSDLHTGVDVFRDP